MSKICLLKGFWQLVLNLQEFLTFLQILSGYISFCRCSITRKLFRVREWPENERVRASFGISEAVHGELEQPPGPFAGWNAPSVGG